MFPEHPSTPPKDELIQEGSVAASLLFSPGFRKAPETADKKWTCIECNMTNDAVNDYCEGCLTDKPQYSCFNNESLSTNCDMSKDNNEKWKQCQTDKNGQCSDIEIPTRKCKCKECEWENTEDGSCEMCCSRGTSNEAKSGRRDDAHGDFQREQGTDNSQSNKRSPSSEFNPYFLFLVLVMSQTVFKVPWQSSTTITRGNRKRRFGDNQRRVAHSMAS